MTKPSGSCTDSTAFSPGGSSIEFDGEFGETVAQSLRQIDARAPENLPVIFDFGQRIGIVAGDAAHPRAHREGHLDHLVERRLIARGAQRAGIFVVIDGLERRAGIEHAAAAGAEHIPRQFEQAEPRGVQERGDGAFFVEAVLGGKIEHIDAAEIAIGRVAHRALDRGDAIGIGRLPQHIEESFGFAHRLNPRSRLNPCAWQSMYRAAAATRRIGVNRRRGLPHSELIHSTTCVARDQRRRQMAGEDFDIFALRILGGGIEGIFGTAAVDRIELADDPKQRHRRRRRAHGRGIFRNHRRAVGIEHAEIDDRASRSRSAVCPAPYRESFAARCPGPRRSIAWRAPPRRRRSCASGPASGR